VVWSATPARPYGDVVETTTPDPLTGRTVVTNLRLPGQYDERLLGSLGLQGPYYNWNRWYLPGMGRYLELDPIAAGGGFNGPTGPEWHAYSAGNPLRFADSSGLRNEPPLRRKDGKCCYGWSCVDCGPYECPGRKGQTFNECMNKCFSYTQGPWWLQLGALGASLACPEAAILQAAWAGTFALICVDICNCIDFP
jgi:RHS repeat-associated protein